MKQELIYRLRIKRRSTAAMYPSFHIYDAELLFYPTKEAAEDKMRGFGWGAGPILLHHRGLSL